MNKWLLSFISCVFMLVAGWLLVLPTSAAPTTDIPGGNISTDTTWTVADSPYDVLGSVTIINGATLTIEAGVELNFNAATQALTVSDGALIANGTMTDTIVFGSSGEMAGDWRGIYVAGNGSAELSHCDIAYAGANSTFGAIRFSSSAASISNCTIRDGSTTGVVLNGLGITPTLSAITISGHTDAAISQSTIAMRPTYSDLRVSNNGTDAINIPGGTLAADLTLTAVGTITNAARTADQVIPYRFTGSVVILADRALTLTSEADVRFNNTNHLIDVRSGGQFSVVGSETAPIKLRSDSGAAGSWYGVYARSGAHVDMTHCELVGAGSTINGSIYVATSDALVENCTVRNGDNHGVVLAGAGITPSLRSVAIVSNTGTAVYQSTVDMTPSFENLIVSDNGIDAIDAGSGSLTRQLTLVPAGIISGSVRAVGDVIPYRFRSTVTILDSAALTVTGEADLRLNNTGHFIDVRSGGQLTLAGTLTDSITIQSDSGVAGSWYGVYARSGSRVAMSHCELIGAGSTANGSLYLETSDALVEECTLRDGDNHGVVLNGAGLTPTLRNVAIMSNTGTAVRQSTVDMNPIYEDLVVSGNGIDAIDAGAGSISRDITLVPAGVVTGTTRSGGGDVIPYRFSSTVTVQSGSTLSVTENADLRFNNSAHFLDVRSGGALRLLGGPAPVRIGSDAQTAGSWYGVYIRAGASATLDRCEIGYGGSTSNGGLYIGSSDVTVSFCNIHNNDNAGIVVNNAQPTLDCNLIEDNVAGLINQTTGVEVDATNNWWGDASGPFNAADNASGTGNSVSDGVLFAPWKAAPTAVSLLNGGVSAEITLPAIYYAFSVIALISIGLISCRFRRTQEST